MQKTLLIITSFIFAPMAFAYQVAVLGPYDSAYCDSKEFGPAIGETISINRVGHGEYEFVDNRGGIVAQECEALTISRANQERVYLPTDFLNVNLLVEKDAQTLSFLLVKNDTGNSIGNCLFNTDSLTIENLVGKSWMVEFDDGPSFVQGFRKIISKGQCNFPSFNGLAKQKEFRLAHEKEMLNKISGVIEGLTLGEYNYCSVDVLPTIVKINGNNTYSLKVWQDWAALNNRTLSIDDQLCVGSQNDKMTLIQELVGKDSFQKVITDALENNSVSVEAVVSSLGRLAYSKKSLNTIELDNFKMFMAAHPESYDQILKLSCTDKFYRNSSSKDCIISQMKQLSFIPSSVLNSTTEKFSYKEMVRIRPLALVDIAAEGVNIESIYQQLLREHSYIDGNVYDMDGVKKLMSIFKDYPELLIKQNTDLLVVKDAIRPDLSTLKLVAASHAERKSAKSSLLERCGLSVKDLFTVYRFTIAEMLAGGIFTNAIHENLKGVISDKELVSGLKDAGVLAPWFISNGYKKKFLIEEIGFTREDFKRR